MVVLGCPQWYLTFKIGSVVVSTAVGGAWGGKAGQVVGAATFLASEVQDTVWVEGVLRGFAAACLVSGIGALGNLLEVRLRASA
jgi:hypothetical protein